MCKYKVKSLDDLKMYFETRKYNRFQIKFRKANSY